MESTEHTRESLPFFINKLNNVLLGMAFEAEQHEAGRISIILKIMVSVISARDSKLLTNFAQLCLDFKKESIPNTLPPKFGTFTNN